MNLGPADLSLARRLEECSAAAGSESARALSRLKPDSGAEVVSIGGGVAAWFGSGSPLSQAQGLGLHGPVPPEDLDRLDAFFLRRGSTASIEVSSLADPTLLPALCRRGFVIAEQTHMLARPARLDSADAEDPGSVSVALIADDDAKGKAILAETVLRGFFEGPGDPPEGMAEIMSGMTASPGSSGWLAWIDGEPAGGAVMLTHQGVALLAGDATLPGARRRGVQLALIRARLAHAGSTGCDLIAACTMPGSLSQRNYERQGFRVVYVRTLMVHEPDPGTGVGA